MFTYSGVCQHFPNSNKTFTFAQKELEWNDMYNHSSCRVRDYTQGLTLWLYSSLPVKIFVIYTRNFTSLHKMRTEDLCSMDQFCKKTALANFLLLNKSKQNVLSFPLSDSFPFHLFRIRRPLLRRKLLDKTQTDNISTISSKKPFLYNLYHFEI